MRCLSNCSSTPSCICIDLNVVQMSSMCNLNTLKLVWNWSIAQVTLVAHIILLCVFVTFGAWSNSCIVSICTILQWQNRSGSYTTIHVIIIRFILQHYSPTSNVLLVIIKSHQVWSVSTWIESFFLDCSVEETLLFNFCLEKNYIFASLLNFKMWQV